MPGITEGQVGSLQCPRAGVKPAVSPACSQLGGFHKHADFPAGSSSISSSQDWLAVEGGEADVGTSTLRSCHPPLRAPGPMTNPTTGPRSSPSAQPSLGQRPQAGMGVNTSRKGPAGQLDAIPCSGIAP